MWLIAEGLALVWIAAGIAIILRSGPAACLLRLGGLAAAWFAAAGAGWLAQAILAGGSLNLWLHVAIVLAAGVVAGALAWWAWARLARAWRPAWIRVLDAGWTGRGLAAVLVLGWLGGHAAAWAILVNLLASADPAFASAARERSLISARLLAARDQDAGLDALGRGIDRLLAASGAQRGMDLLDALRWIAGLEADERRRLIAGQPSLRALADDPAMRRVVEDERLMRLVAEAGGGSLPAVYALGDEPAIRALAESPGMRAALAAFDPVALRRQALAASADEAALAWRLRSLAWSTDRDQALVDSAGWTTAAAGVLTWDGDEAYGLAWAGLPPGGAGRRLRIACASAWSCWLDERLLAPEGRGEERELILPPAGGRLVLLVDFRAGAPRQARIGLSAAARPTSD